MWGIIPAAGAGSRIQPLAFSKELLPVGSRLETGGPRAVSEYLVERLLLAGADKLCFIIGPGKWDILAYYGKIDSAQVAFVVQPQPAGLCDALFRPAPMVPESETVAVGLPDTIWFPEDALKTLPEGELVFLLFPVAAPELFDAVLVETDGRITRMLVKEKCTENRLIWGAFKVSGRIYHRLHELWLKRGRCDQYIGTLVNAYLDEGGKAFGWAAGQAYVDVGTVHGYRQALELLRGRGL